MSGFVEFRPGVFARHGDIVTASGGRRWQFLADGASPRWAAVDGSADQPPPELCDPKLKPDRSRFRPHLGHMGCNPLPD